MTKAHSKLSKAAEREIREVFPYLVALAKKKKPPIEYGELYEATGVHFRRWLGRALGNIRAPEMLYSILEPEQWSERGLPDYPMINTLAINKDDRAPGEEWALDPRTNEEYKDLETAEERRQYVKPYQDEVYRYRHWDRIIADLGLSAELRRCERLVKDRQ